MPKTREEQAERTAEMLRFKQRWQELLDRGDPYYNPNLSLEHSWFAPKNKKYED